MAQLKEGSIIKKATGDEIIATINDIPEIPAPPTKTSQLINDSGFLNTLPEHNHDGTYEPADSTILKDADIGTTVQGYNANTVIDSGYVHTDNNYTTAEKSKLAGIETGAEVNVNADWNASSGDAQIINKPTTLSGYGITDALALGETSLTAYRGDKGKTAYDHSQVTNGSNPHNTTFANIASKPTTLSGYGITDALSSNKVLTFSKSVLTTDFSADATYSDYGYRATITCSGITSSYAAQVNFNATEVLGGTFAPFTYTGSGVVYIYSTEVPSATISVNIIATKVV